MKNIVLILILFVTIKLSGSEQRQFFHFNKSNDFPFNMVDNVMQDSHGYLWIGSSNGLARYDGYTFEVYNTQDKKNGLPSNRIFCTLETSNGDILVGTNLGLVVYDRKTNTFTLLSYSCTPNIYEDKNNQIWVATFDGVDVRDSKSLQIKTSFFCEEDNNIKVFEGLTIDTYGRTWSSSNNSGIYVFDTKTNTFQRHINSAIIDGIEQFKVIHLQFDNHGTLWMGTSGNGLISVDTATYETKTYVTKNSDQTSIGSNNISDIYVDTKGDVWVCCQYGYLNRFNREQNNFERFTPNVHNARFINTNSISCINQDNNGNYWVGTYDNGMYCLNEIYNNFQTFISLPDFSNTNSIGSITSFAELDNGTIALASNGGGIKFYNPENNSIEEFSNNKQLSSNNILKIIRQKNILWGATWGGGIFKIDLNTNKVTNFVHDIHNPNGINTNNTVELFASDSALVIGTHGAGLAFYNYSKHTFTHKSNFKSVAFDPIINNWVNHINKDSRDNLWISTYYGLNKLHNNNLTHYGTDSTVNSINGFEVLATFEDSRKQLWVLTTLGVDLYNYDNDNFTRIGEQYSLPTNTRSLIEDNEGNMWLCSADKVIKISVPGYKIEIFDKNDGIISGELNNNAIFKASDGTLYFGSSEGFMKCMPSKMKTDTIKPQLCFRNLYVNYIKQTPDSTYLKQPIETADTLEYEYTEDVISIEIAAILLGRSNKIDYSYSFDTAQGSWLQLGKDRIISFTALRPGTHILTIRATVENGISTQKNITIIIQPKWWMTWWFKVIISLLIIATVAWIIYWRTHTIKDQNYLLEKLVKERTQNLEEANNKLVKQSELLEKQNENLNESKLVIEMKNEDLTEALATKDKLIGIISHDFKNPLTSLLGVIAILKKKDITLDKEKYNNYLDIAEKSIKKLVTQMVTVLDWAQGTLLNIKYNPVDVNLESLIIDTIQLLHEAARQKNINIETQTNYTYCAYVDPRMINTVFRNLLHNAIKFTPNGGNIVITINEDDTMLEVSFVDTGIGMPQKKLDELFTAFNPENISYGTNSEKGTGLGLGICKGFVEKNEGRIHAKSEEGKGSVFTISVPKGNSKVSNPKVLGKKEPFSTPHKNDYTETPNRSVLLIDDNEELVNILQSTLTPDYKIIKAYEGTVGLHLAQNMVPDIIVSDINMPKMSGLDLCRQIKADNITCHIPIILISSEKRQNIETECYECGASDFLEKPFDPSILRHKVDLLLTVSNEQKKSDNEPSTMFHLPESADDTIIRNLYKLVIENIDNPNYDIDMICSKIGLSRTQLWRKTKNSLNKTPSELIRDLRMQKAKEMLLKEKYRISDIAYHVGYNDPKVFYRNFTNTFGMSPTEFIKQQKSESS